MGGQRAAALVLATATAWVAGCTLLYAPESGGAPGRVRPDGAAIAEGGSPVPTLPDGAPASVEPCAEANLETSGRHCGRCGHDCFGGECVGGSCRPVAILPGVRGLGVASAGGYLYVGMSSRITRLAPDGSGAVDVVNGVDPGYLATAGGYLYWADRSDSVKRWPLGGGDVETIVTPVRNVLGIAADTTHVYFTRYVTNGTVERALLDGGGRQVLLSGYENPEDVELAGRELLVGGDGEDELVAIPLDDGGVPRLLSAGGAPVSMALDAETSTVFFVQQGSDTIHQIPLAGGDKSLVALAGGRPCGITLTADSIYWIVCDEGVLMRLAR